MERKPALRQQPAGKDRNAACAHPKGHPGTPGRLSQHNGSYRRPDRTCPNTLTGTARGSPQLWKHRPRTSTGDPSYRPVTGAFLAQTPSGPKVPGRNERLLLWLNPVLSLSKGWQRSSSACWPGPVSGDTTPMRMPCEGPSVPTRKNATWRERPLTGGSPPSRPGPNCIASIPAIPNLTEY